MKPTAVVFDIGGVLLDWNPAYLYRKLLQDDDAVADFLGNVCTSAWNQQFDAGMPFADGISALGAAYPEKQPLIAAYWQRWDEMLGGEIPGTPDILRTLKSGGVPVHAISNWSAETFPIAAQRHPFLDLFEVLVVSGREGLVKPDRGIFDLFLERSGLDAASCIFIDDNPANIRTAAGIGFDAIHFTDANRLAADLRSRGMLGTVMEVSP